jgi:hypothetical protein
MKRTTILADEGLLTEIKHLAAREGKTVTTVVREALAAYVADHQRGRRYSLVGIGRSGSGDVARRAEEILAREITRDAGWSPRRGPSRAAAPDQ